ncbi:MAG: hypothetical protein Roseis2KO_30500 [Roseivirga sp.]
MEKGSKQISPTHSQTLPRLEDPKHPGMLLISRIGLFSLALFALLIALAMYLAATVSLDINLSLNDVTKTDDQFVIYAEPAKAVMVEAGQQARISLANGDMLDAEVLEVQPAITQEAESIPIILQSTGTLSTTTRQYLQANTGAAISATVFTRHSLRTFLKEKVDY